MAKPHTTVVLTPQMPTPWSNTRYTAMRNAIVRARLTAKPIHQARHVHRLRSSSGEATIAFTASNVCMFGKVQRGGAAAASALVTAAIVMTAPCHNPDWDCEAARDRWCAGG